MSRDAVVAFLDCVREDEILRGSLGSTPTADAYVGGGRRMGYVFSVGELRSVMNAEQFYLRVMRDSVLSKRVSTASSEHAVVALANEEGFECELEDLQAVLIGTLEEELSEVELGSVVGGRGGFSFPNVAKTPAPPFGSVPVPYPNFG